MEATKKELEGGLVAAKAAADEKEFALEAARKEAETKTAVLQDMEDRQTKLAAEASARTQELDMLDQKRLQAERNNRELVSQMELEREALPGSLICKAGHPPSSLLSMEGGCQDERRSGGLALGPRES
jgi:hypothetical protein